MRKTLTVVICSLSLAAATSARAGWEEGRAALQAGDYQRAVTEFEGVVEEHSDWAPGFLMLGQALLKANRPGDAITRLNEANRLQPGDNQIQLALGQAFLAGRRYADAAALLGKVNESGLSAQQVAALHQMLAQALEKSGQDDQALAEFARAAHSNPNDAAIQYRYGITAFNAGDYRAAVDALGKAVQISPSGDNRRAYVMALTKMGRESQGAAKTDAYQRAVRTAKQLVDAKGSAENLRLLRDAQLGAKDFDGVIATCKRLTGADATDWLSYYYSGQAYTKKEQYAAAEAELKRALNNASRNSDQTTIWGQLGFVYEKAKQYDSAILAYQRAGNNTALARVRENKETAEYNASVEEQNRIIEEMRQQEEVIRQELEDLPGGTSEPPPLR